jgi:hypothetical protein
MQCKVSKVLIEFSLVEKKVREFAIHNLVIGSEYKYVFIQKQIHYPHQRQTIKYQTRR